ncbi:hypothetical protein [Chelativorans sp. AA-79]|uniref:EF-hand domain-containing protein n=1 Tax=Chelativorans sp. AA-79 TaxID=3028735 RepID=UPI0023F900F1|nr:hypothetical protein [Chelativorans sp. AA-79]WEX07977.1 hypothetical protein PVE73_18020 [Chelativorans sp. AA-79]
MTQLSLRCTALAIVVGAGALSAANPAFAQRLDTAQMLTRADLNGDGQVTRDEFQEARSTLFDRLDRNRDGYLDNSDAPRRPLARQQIGERLNEFLQVFDRNGDDRMSHEEFVGGPSYVFAYADTDGNGVIDSGELQLFRQNAQDLRR